MSNILTQLNDGMFSDQKGYWKARGYETFPGWSAPGLPFQDFFENLDGNHKKMWLDLDGKMKADRLTYQGDSLIPLYQGIVDTQRIVVGTGYFIYSTLIVNLHLSLAKYSRKLTCEPTVAAVLATANPEAVEDITNRAMALRLAAYIIYEGDGLGGYKDATWLLWGRLKGVPCPDNPALLSAEEALECFREYKDADNNERQEMFTEWWKEISPAHAAISDVIIGHIYTGYRLVTRYQEMESPYCSGRQQFSEDSIVDIQAALCGFFRRSAAGIGEAAVYDPNDLDNVANRFADMLSVAYEKLESILTSHTGKPTAFGVYILNLLDINNLRNECVDNVVARQELNELDKTSLMKSGFKLKVNKQGRTRR